MSSLDSDHHIRCASLTCGFVVGDTYMVEKQRFPPGICPRCGANIRVVDPYTMVTSATHVLQVNPRHRSYRRVVTIEETAVLA